MNTTHMIGRIPYLTQDVRWKSSLGDNCIVSKPLCALSQNELISIKYSPRNNYTDSLTCTIDWSQNVWGPGGLIAALFHTVSTCAIILCGVTTGRGVPVISASAAAGCAIGMPENNHFYDTSASVRIHRKASTLVASTQIWSSKVSKGVFSFPSHRSTLIMLFMWLSGPDRANLWLDVKTLESTFCADSTSVVTNPSVQYTTLCT